MPQNDKGRSGEAPLSAAACQEAAQAALARAAGDAPAHGEDTGLTMRTARFAIGDVVQHKHFPFRGVVFDVDPVFDNTEEWWLSIPEEIRPRKDQPFYHLLAENADNEYVAYVSEQNLEPDRSGEPLRHPRVAEELVPDGAGGWRMPRHLMN